MKTISLLLLASLGPLSFAADSVEYDSAITFARERCEAKISKEKTIFCLGPEQVDEIYFNDGKEEKKIARFARLFDSDNVKTVGNLLSSVNLNGNVTYEVCIYRSDKKKLLVRVMGVDRELQNSQFTLKSGDLIIIQRPAKNE